MSVRPLTRVCGCLVIQLRVPSGQMTSGLGPRPPRGGLKRPPPSRETATDAGSTNSEAGNSVQLEEPYPAVRNPVPRPLSTISNNYAGARTILQGLANMSEYRGAKAASVPVATMSLTNKPTDLRKVRCRYTGAPLRCGGSSSKVDWASRNDVPGCRMAPLFQWQNTR
jgi:hypothetical protein